MISANPSVYTAQKMLLRSQGDPRLAALKRNRKILKWLLGIVLTVDGALALLLVYLLFLHTSYFNLQQVEVTGNRRLSRAEVLEASEVEIGINLLTVDLQDIASKLKRHPWIRSATVYRRFPGQLILEIEERNPRAILAAGKLYYVDEQAEFFTRLLPGDAVHYPLFTGVTPEELRTRGSEVREMIRVGLGLLELLERLGFEDDLSSISETRIHVDDGLQLHLRSGKIIILGKGDFERKVQRYGRLKRFLLQRGEWPSARIINLDFEDRALVRWDKPQVQG